MMVTPGHLYVHAPKTGGTSVKSVLVERCDGRRLGAVHATAWHLDAHPERFKATERRDGAVWESDDFREGRTMLGTVRNPWAWYVSWYRHCLEASNEAREALRYYGSGPESVLRGEADPVEDFRRVLRNVARPGSAPRWAGGLWEASPEVRAHWPASGLGLCSYTFAYFYGAERAPRHWPSTWAVDVLVDTGSLSEALPTVLDIDLDEAPRKNSRSERRVKGPESLTDWYTDELVALVSVSDAELIATFGYRFGESADVPVLMTERAVA